MSHRLSTLMACDSILVMDGGRIVAAGKHDELLQGNEIYAKLWRKQNRNL